jgi:hypothetical protein
MYAGQAWLNHFAFRITLGVETFLIPSAILFVAALLTVSSKCYSIAASNPTRALRKD